MRRLNANEVSELSGLGYVSEVHESPDGNLYEWIDGVDERGASIGFWQGLPEVQVDAPALGGVGALYEASDGSLYQVHGFAEGEDEPADAAAAPEGGADDGGAEGAPKMGPGHPGEIRVGPDHKHYRWVVGVGPAGKRVGFWRRLHPRAHPQAHPRPMARPHPQPAAAAARRHHAPPQPGRRRKPLLARILPIAKAVTSLIPGVGPAVAAGLTVATPLLKKAGVAGDDRLGALYAAPDGSLYQVQGFSDDVAGAFAADGDLDGFGVDPEPASLLGDEDLRGVMITEPTNAQLQEYLPQDRVGGLAAYVPDPPRRARTDEHPREQPELFKPLW